VRVWLIAGLLAVLSVTTAVAQSLPAKPPDLALAAANEYVGPMLFLRCFCAANTLSFDAAGHLLSKSQTTDWTLAGVKLDKVVRRSPTEIQFDGTRIAMRYNPGAHEFEQHPQKDQPLRVTIALEGSAPAAAALSTIFSFGIDPALQRAMPAYWKHYFDAALAWPQDALTGKPIYTPGQRLASSPAGVPASVTSPVLLRRDAPGYSAEAQHDRVQGTVTLRLVVAANGEATRVALLTPLGYGLDARAAEAASHLRFQPATLDGQPVAAYVQLNQQFAITAP
jgi:TonB family protein